MSVSNFKLEAAFFAWSFLASLLSGPGVACIIQYLQIFPILLLGLILHRHIYHLKFSCSKLEKNLMSGVVLAIVLFYIEYYSGGVLSIKLRQFFQSQPNPTFSLSMLDRECALLSISSWIMIGLLVKSRRYLYGIMLYCVVLYLLSISDSLASFLGFLIGGIVFLMARFAPVIMIRVISIFIIICSLSLPVWSYFMNPMEIANKFDNVLPDSAKHRLFIWHSVSNKIIEKPVLGAGVNASKMISKNNVEKVSYHQYYWSLFPSHPHNNVLQTLLEIGIVGLVLFLSLLYKYSNAIMSCLRKGQVEFGSASYAFLINYYIIGSISFNVWQTWWICSGIWVAIIMKLLLGGLERSKKGWI